MRPDAGDSLKKHCEVLEDLGVSDPPIHWKKVVNVSETWLVRSQPSLVAGGTAWTDVLAIRMYCEDVVSDSSLVGRALLMVLVYVHIVVVSATG